MPELGEVAFYSKQWEQASGKNIRSVRGNVSARIYRDCSLVKIKKHLTGKTLNRVQRRAKWANFLFEEKTWLSIHLGMTGSLRHQSNSSKKFLKHDHLILQVSDHSKLIFSDSRMFGKILMSSDEKEPLFWKQFGPEVLSQKFNLDYFHSILDKRKNSPLKALLLEQRYFPGVGNWMADEILFKSQIHPERRARELKKNHINHLYKNTRKVCLRSENKISIQLNDIPKTWLFWRRWDRDLKNCPKTGQALKRITVGGRSSIYSPEWQKN